MVVILGVVIRSTAISKMPPSVSLLDATVMMHVEGGGPRRAGGNSNNSGLDCGRAHRIERKIRVRVGESYYIWYRTSSSTGFKRKLPILRDDMMLCAQFGGGKLRSNVQRHRYQPTSLLQGIVVVPYGSTLLLEDDTFNRR